MKTLTRKLMRDIGGAKGQSLAVMAVVMCGIACYVTIASAHRNLLLTRDTYYAKYRLADFFISLERAPANAVFRIEAIPGVREARGRIVKDVNLDIAGFEESRVGRLISMPDRERRLKDLVDGLRDRFEYIVIDCPPSLGLLTLNGLVAADSVLIPLHCEFFALEGLADLVGTMRRVRGAYNPTLDIEGELLTMYDERTNLGQQVARDVRDFFKDKVFTTVIPRNVRLGEAPSHGVPGVVYDARSRGAEAYLALAREVIERTTRPTAA